MMKWPARGSLAWRLYALGLLQLVLLAGSVVGVGHLLRGSPPAGNEPYVHREGPPPGPPPGRCAAKISLPASRRSRRKVRRRRPTRGARGEDPTRARTALRAPSPRS